MGLSKAQLRANPDKYPPVKAARRYALIPRAALYADANPLTIRTWIAQGKITMYRSGAKFIRVDLNEIDALLERGA